MLGQLKPLILPLNFEPFHNDYVELVKKYVLENLKTYDCKIFVYGSRARGVSHRFSDLDVGIIPQNDERLPIDDIQDFLNYESIVPFKIDLVDFSITAEKFKQHALQNIIWWRE
jgi:predicted nucleotidyltransferase